MDINEAPFGLILPGQVNIAGLPSAALYPRKYMWVTDLFGGPGDYVISDGTNWKPVRPLAVQSPVAADMTISALVNAPTQIVTGTIGTAVTRTVSLGTANAYPGAKFRVVRQATGLGSLIAGLVGISINGWADFEYNGSAWIQTGSGGLL
ncbi:hypothetical protein Herbaro_09400 [Herbaspirillum sp. WKF16]|uniref:hypothetical protein n=1 Tax=Herbaspirillum sp. WKF16 TaxID=3028312 RepID=UPI0023A9344D|nr:hypothetical protein [Herbaspirillum sp. WKF16]WDZ97975.1 hypothetical protein Herbaro_09400 [Herbaspirillum sp. WKF16]